MKNSDITPRAVNQFFYLPRFYQYMRAHFAEKMRSYVWFFATIAILYSLILLFAANDIIDFLKYTNCVVWYYLGLLPSGMIFAIRYFSSLSQTKTALLVLMQPVSTFERWCLALLTTLVFYPLLYTLLFNAMNFLALFLFGPSSEYVEGTTYYFIPFMFYSYVKAALIFKINQLPLWLFYVWLCGFAVITTVFFKRHPMVKFLVVGFAIFLIFLFCMGMLSSHSLDIFFFWTYDRQYVFGIGVVVINLLIWVFAPLLIWLGCFFALKERELS